MKIRPGAVVREKDALLVLRYEHASEDVYALPGGAVEEDETLAETLERELHEELGILIRTGDVLCVADAAPLGTLPRTLHILFEAHIEKGTPELQPEATSAAEVLWLPLAELDSHTLYPNIAEALRQALKGEGAVYLDRIPHRPWR